LYHLLIQFGSAIALPSFQNDRAIIDFGSLMNSAAVNSAGPFTDSTIEITFEASLIKNSAYTNATAIVTAGAEYDSDNYVWVSQASYTYNMNAVSKLKKLQICPNPSALGSVLILLV
jgi:hypothetical protein